MGRGRGRMEDFGMRRRRMLTAGKQYDPVKKKSECVKKGSVGREFGTRGLMIVTMVGSASRGLSSARL